MAAFVTYYSFLDNLLKGVHDFTNDSTSTITVALSNTAGDIARANSTLIQITQVDYTFCSARIVTNISVSSSGGTSKLIASNDLTLSASGGSVGPFRYIILYDDDTTSDSLIGYSDYTSSITLADTETFTINLNQLDGILSLS